MVLWHWAANFVIDFPTTHNLIWDWENHFHSFSLFILGFVLGTQDGSRQAMTRWRVGALGLAIGLGLMLTFGFWLPEIKWTAKLEALYEFLIKNTYEHFGIFVPSWLIFLTGINVAHYCSWITHW